MDLSGGHDQPSGPVQAGNQPHRAVREGSPGLFCPRKHANGLSIRGMSVIMQHEGGQWEELGPGSFNYVPSKAVHQAWTKPDEGTLLFITVDGPWDVNWVDGPPQAQAK